MSKVNFVSEFNLFMRYARNNNLSMRERMLWIALFYIANDRATYNEQSEEYDWPDGFFPVSNGELNLYCCLDKRAIDTLRNSLKQRGLIDFLPGMKNKRNPSYRLCYLSVYVGYKNVPNDVPNNDPNNAPNDVPNNDPNDVPNAPPYPKYKGTPDIYQNQEKGKVGRVDKDSGEFDKPCGIVKSSPGGTNFAGGQSFLGERWDADSGDFVDLDADSDGLCDSAFVPLPWEEGAG